MAGGDPRRLLGEAGESLACRHLEARGFAVVERNFRTRYGELDVVAADSRYLVFCEVKSRIVRGRPGPLGPFSAIGARKRRQVRLMAREWLAQDGSGPRGGGRTPRPRPPELRFDAIGVSFDAAGRLVELDHLEDAF
ncbi:MAG TPA: YraN family protein [Thermoleophilaceae bacterium]